MKKTKKHMKYTLLSAIINTFMIIIISIIGIYSILRLYPELYYALVGNQSIVIPEKEIQQQTESSTWVEINSGSVSTGNTISPLPIFPQNPIPNKEKTFVEKLETEYQATVYNLPSQPTKLSPGMSYNDRSQILVKYMTQNTIRIPQKKTDQSYIYIKLHKKPYAPVFVYWHNSSNGYWPRSGDLQLNEAVEKISDTEYVFDTSMIPYVRFYDKVPTIYDWKKDIDIWKKPPLFAIASKAFDGNYVEKIIFYTKE